MDELHQASVALRRAEANYVRARDRAVALKTIRGVKRREQRAAIEAMIREYPGMTNVGISVIFGVVEGTVRNIRRSIGAQRPTGRI